MSKLIRCAVLLLGLCAVTPNVWARGALAHGEDGRTGIAFNYDSQRRADQVAVSECGYCRVVATFANICAAIAVGERGGFGWATRPRMSYADEAALDNCREQGNHRCVVKLHACDR